MLKQLKQVVSKLGILLPSDDKVNIPVIDEKGILKRKQAIAKFGLLYELFMVDYYRSPN